MQSPLAGLWGDWLGGTLRAEEVDGQGVLSTRVAQSQGGLDGFVAGWQSHCWAKVFSTCMGSIALKTSMVWRQCLQFYPWVPAETSEPCKNRGPPRKLHSASCKGPMGHRRSCGQRLPGFWPWDLGSYASPGALQEFSSEAFDHAEVGKLGGTQVGSLTNQFTFLVVLKCLAGFALHIAEYLVGCQQSTSDVNQGISGSANNLPQVNLTRWIQCRNFESSQGRFRWRRSAWQPRTLPAQGSELSRFRACCGCCI